MGSNLEHRSISPFLKIMGATTWADEHLDCNCKQRDPLHSYADGTTQEIGTHESSFQWATISLRSRTTLSKFESPRCQEPEKLPSRCECNRQDSMNETNDGAAVPRVQTHTRNYRRQLLDRELITGAKRASAALTGDGSSVRPRPRARGSWGNGGRHRQALL